MSPTLDFSVVIYTILTGPGMHAVRGMTPHCGSATMTMHGKLQLVFNELLHIVNMRTLLRIQALASRK